MPKYDVLLMQASLFKMPELQASQNGSLSPHHWNGRFYRCSSCLTPQTCMEADPVQMVLREVLQHDSGSPKDNPIHHLLL
jgi:hypothetical protein